MYDNIAAKLKWLAKASAITMTIAFIAIGILIIATLGEIGALLGIFLMLFGSLIAWVSSWQLYGFGELVEKACKIEQNTRKDNPSDTTASSYDSERINKLKKLLSQGIITEEEYQTALSNQSQNS